MSFGYTLLPTLHRVVSLLACHLATRCYRRCIAWFPCDSTSYGYTLNFDHVTDAASRGFPVLACHLAAPCDGRCIAWFPSVSTSYGYTFNFDHVTDAASRGFLVLARHTATP